MNRLKVESEKQSKHWPGKGGPGRRVARELGLDRATVSRHWPLDPSNSNTAIPTLGSEAGSNAAIPTAGSKAGRQSHCHPFAALIEGWCQARLSAQRIYQDLVCQHQFTGSYQSVKRFVRKVEGAAPVPFRRMECEPGDEAQVDFGQGAWVVDAEGKKRRPRGDRQ